MKNNNTKVRIIKAKVTMLMLAITLLVVCIVIINFGNTGRAYAYENDSNESISQFQYELDDDTDNLVYNYTYGIQSYAYGIMPLVSGDPFPSDLVSLPPRALFAGATYIPNRDFFIRNPFHMDNNIRNNPGLPSVGGCTTVAAQILLSYHNFFHDRRIIPNRNGFLHAGFGNLDFWPSNQVRAGNVNNHCTFIGTTDAMFWDLFDRTPWSGSPNPLRIQSQFPNNTMQGMRRFLDAHYRNVNGHSLSSNVLLGYRILDTNRTIDRAITEINAGRPIILGFPYNPVQYHQVVAYGYAHVNGVFGFIVHWGWRTDTVDGTDRHPSNHVWLPASRFNNYIRMQLHSTPYLVVTGESRTNLGTGYDILRCIATGAEKLREALVFEQIPSTIFPWMSSGNVRVRLRAGSMFSGRMEIPSTVVIRGSTRTVTEIPSNAFEGFRGTHITLPSTVTYIGSGAFRGSGLESITIPRSVERIRYNAFRDNFNLTSVTFENGSRLNRIGDSAFRNTSVEAFDLPDSLVEINSSAFSHNRLPNWEPQRVTLPRSVRTIGGGAFSSFARIYLAHGWTSIPDNFFSGTNARIVIIPPTVASIGNNAFITSTSTLRIYLASGWTHIPDSFFAGTNARNVSIPHGVTHIGSRAFEGLLGTGTTLNIPGTVMSIGDNAFPASANIVFPNGFTLRGNAVVGFAGPAGLGGNLDIPPQIFGIPITAIGANAFDNAPSINHITLPDTITYIGNSAFRGNRIRSITIPKSVERIRTNAFSSSTRIYLAYGWTHIPNGFFSGANARNIVIPSTVTSIGANAFSASSSLRIYLASGRTHIEDGLFAGTNAGNVYIPYGVTHIGSRAFEGFLGTTISLPSTVTSIGEYAFVGAAQLRSIIMSSYNPPVVDDTVFLGVARSNIELRVPMGREQAYIDAGWTGFRGW